MLIFVLNEIYNFNYNKMYKLKTDILFEKLYEPTTS